MHPAKILPSSHTFSSRVFAIRFASETVTLHELCLFATEVDFLPSPPAQNCFVNVELFFAEITAIGPLEASIPEVVLREE